MKTKAKIKILVFYPSVFVIIIFICSVPIFWLKSLNKIKWDIAKSIIHFEPPTEYENFIDKEFKKLTLGLNMEEVIYRLGNPIGKAISGPWDIWCYSAKPKQPRTLYFLRGNLAEIELSPQGTSLCPKHYYIVDHVLEKRSGINTFPIRGTYGYSIGYNNARFDKVREGMTKDDVLELLGEPMYIQKDDSQIEQWVYGLGSVRQGKRVVVRIIHFSNLYVSRIEKSGTGDW